MKFIEVTAAATYVLLSAVENRRLPERHPVHGVLGFRSAEAKDADDRVDRKFLARLGHLEHVADTVYVDGPFHPAFEFLSGNGPALLIHRDYRRRDRAA